MGPDSKALHGSEGGFQLASGLVYLDSGKRASLGVTLAKGPRLLWLIKGRLETLCTAWS